MALSTQVKAHSLVNKTSMKLIGQIAGVDALQGVLSNPVTVYGDLDVTELQCEGCGFPPTINTGDLKVITISGTGFEMCKKSIQAIVFVNPSVMQAARKKCPKGSRCQKIKVEQLKNVK